MSNRWQSIGRAAAGGIWGLLRMLFGVFGRWLLPIILIGAAVFMFMNPAMLSNLRRLLGGRAPTVISAPVVITQIRSMSTLVTASFESQVSVEARKERILRDERVMLQVEGTILAGIDLSQITEQDITVSGDEVVVRLPPARIVSQDVRNVSMMVDPGLIPGINPKLQTAAEEQGRAELLKAACAYGLLDKAEQEAQVALGNLLRKLDGVRTIRLVQTDPGPGFVTGCT